ncbi:glycoside hydrolase family 6 protein [Solirubrobacter soli]|uniref:glycoside hydrolase family 6 protein n=1 Tax=Solirubrobacter soli TaxID=363832 RepID=UPI0004236D6B|nr:glycoside hydrolase family 6 protein [Solirubrobacter soli]
MRLLLALILLAVAAPAAQAERVLTPQATLWVDPDSSTAHVDSADARRLATYASATWLTGGDPYGDARRVTRAANGQVPVIVAYDIPGRDCGSYSAGGAKDGAAYRSWVRRLAKGISTRTAVVIVEPDALASGCVKTSLVEYAVTRLSRLQHTGVYIDAGHSNWQPAKTMRTRLRNAAIAKADGIALNVSNYRTNTELIAYAKHIGPYHFVLDTSRNGQGPFAGEQDWCNPPGRGLGERPTTTTNTRNLDAYLWIKTPGESDGECRSGPPAGQWFAQRAAELISNANPPL